MTAILIQFPTASPGNGALEVVGEYFDRVHPSRVMARAMVDGPEFDWLPDSDHFLMWLWENGFKVVPLEDRDLGD